MGKSDDAQSPRDWWEFKKKLGIDDLKIDDVDIATQSGKALNTKIGEMDQETSAVDYEAKARGGDIEHFMRYGIERINSLEKDKASKIEMSESFHACEKFNRANRSKIKDLERNKMNCNESLARFEDVESHNIRNTRKIREIDTNMLSKVEGGARFDVIESQIYNQSNQISNLQQGKLDISQAAQRFDENEARQAIQDQNIRDSMRIVYCFRLNDLNAEGVSKVKFKLPADHQLSLLHVSAYADTATATSAEVDILDDGESVLNAAIDVQTEVGTPQVVTLFASATVAAGSVKEIRCTQTGSGETTGVFVVLTACFSCGS